MMQSSLPEHNKQNPILHPAIKTNEKWTIIFSASYVCLMLSNWSKQWQYRDGETFYRNINVIQRPHAIVIFIGLWDYKATNNNNYHN